MGIAAAAGLLEKHENFIILIKGGDKERSYFFQLASASRLALKVYIVGCPGIPIDGWGAKSWKFHHIEI